MPSYRFCRPDDIPLLVRAVNECWRVHFPGEPEMTVDRFRREMKELDVWPSNSMVAMGGAGGSEPIAVSIGTKRAHEVMVHRVGVRPDHLRQGHGRHLVTSLSQKLAVLGPPRLVAEVPRSPAGAEAFFRAAGYREEATSTDYRRETGGDPGRAADDGLVAPVTVGELEAAGVLAASLSRAAAPSPAWERTRETLLQSAERLAGLALASPERIAAWLLYLPAEAEGGAVRMLAFGGPTSAAGAGSATSGESAAPDPARRAGLVGLLLTTLARRSAAPVVLVKLAPDELPAALLAELGFARGEEYARLAAEATPL